MLPFEDRYTRQRKLPELGREGQIRLQQTPMVVAASRDESAWVEALYLHRAGVEQVQIATAVPRPQRVPQFPYAETFASDATRALAAGAYRALCQLRRALGIIEPSGERR